MITVIDGTSVLYNVVFMGRYKDDVKFNFAIIIVIINVKIMIIMVPDKF